jgi:hypothetical protein
VPAKYTLFYSFRRNLGLFKRQLINPVHFPDRSPLSFDLQGRGRSLEIRAEKACDIAPHGSRAGEAQTDGHKLILGERGPFKALNLAQAIGP